MAGPPIAYSNTKPISFKATWSLLSNMVVRRCDDDDDDVSEISESGHLKPGNLVRSDLGTDQGEGEKQNRVDNMRGVKMGELCFGCRCPQLQALECNQQRSIQRQRVEPLEDEQEPTDRGERDLDHHKYQRNIKLGNI